MTNKYKNKEIKRADDNINSQRSAESSNCPQHQKHSLPVIRATGITLISKQNLSQ